ncbi:Bactericidal permeability-increasing protein [Trichinella spiralis]|uniref:Bactericidal permeability-increasing protein n=1 Tax=Trichinella spiralis TaxID=6334 RepID=A0ABR3KES9_TRISP
MQFFVYFLLVCEAISLVHHASTKRNQISSKPISRKFLLPAKRSIKVYNFLNGGKPNNPGVVLMLTDRAFNAIQSSTDLVGTKVIDVGQQARFAIKPRAPNSIQITFDNLDVTTTSDVLRRRNVGMVTSELLDIQGNLIVSLVALMYRGVVSLNRPRRIEEIVRGMLNDKLCTDIGTAASRASSMLKMPFQDKPLLDRKSSSPVSPDFMRRIVKMMPLSNQKRFNIKSNSLVFRPSLVAAPYVSSSPSFLAIPMNGQICARGRCKMPFYPKPLPKKLRSPQRMMNIYISDYVGNSFLYTLYDLGLFNMTFSKNETPWMGYFFETACPQSVCITDVLPEFSRVFPDQQPEVKIHFLQPPAMRFENGTIHLFGDFEIQVLAKRKTESTASRAIVGNIQFSMLVKPNKPKRNLITGTMQFDKWTFQPTENQLEADQASLNHFSDYTKQILETSLRKFLTDGFPMASQNTQISNAQFEVLENALFAAFDFKVNQAQLIQAVSQAM